MKQVLNAKGQIIVEEVPVPSVEPGQILVKTAFSCISTGTELSGLRASATPIWRKALQKPQHVKKVFEIARDKGISSALDAIDTKLGTPKALGYSLSGEVVAVGDGVTGFKIGDLVACAGAQCANHAEYVCVPVNLAVHLPKGADLQSASMVALGAIALQGVRRLEPTLGETFLVVGLGVLGQLTIQILKASGCRVIGADLNKKRLEIALSLGMDAALNAEEKNASQTMRLTQGIGADGVLITASGGTSEIISQAFQSCRKKGRVVLVGDVPLQLDRADMYEKELDFRISTSYGPGRYDRAFEESGVDYPFPYVRWTETRNMAAFLDLVANQSIRTQNLIEGIFAVESAPEAFIALKEKQPMTCLLEYKNAGSPKIQNIAVNTIPSASKNPRLAVIGAGSFVENVHLPNLKALKNSVELESLVCRTGHKAKNLATRFGAKKAETSWENTVADSQVDAVLIGTRHDQHAHITLHALEKGKHVLVEKPLTLNEIELNEIEKFYSAHKNTPILMTGYNRRFSPAAVEAKKHLEKRSGPAIIQYRMNAGFLPADHWVHGPEGGGRNIGEACHIYDLFLFLIGSQVKSTQVSSLGSGKEPYRTDDNFIATFTFTDGSIASLLYTSMGNISLAKEHMSVFFDGKVLELDDYKSLTYLPAPGKREEMKTESKGHAEELEAFFSGLKAGKFPIPLQEQFASARMSFAVQKLLHNAKQD